MAGHRFASWLRQGLGAVDGAVVHAGQIRATARVTISGATETVPVALHGPGDIAGLKRETIVRREPAPYSTGVSPHRFPFVELRPADLPWRFSPPVAAGGRPHPWLALVVVPAAVGVAPKSGAPLPVMNAPCSELPDPGELWAWAHVQVESSAGNEPVAEIARRHPDRAIARVVSPRRLSPRTRYRVCLVPTFEAGRRAGLGEPAAQGGGLVPAWTPGDGTCELPVYDSWEIETGDGVDFETIAGRLRGDDAGSLFAPRTIDVRDAVGSSSPLLGTMSGLLRAAGQGVDLPRDEEIASWLAARLAPEDAGVIGLPIYGGAAARRSTVRVSERGSDWVAELNLDPRLRLMAAAGADVVRADQEKLVAEVRAMKLVAEVRAMQGQEADARAAILGAELATLAVGRLKTRHVQPRPPGRAAAMLWAAQEARPAVLDPALLSPAFRRMARSGGIARGRRGGLAWTRMGRDLELSVVKPQPADVGGITTVARVRAALSTPPTPSTPSTPSTPTTPVIMVPTIRIPRLSPLGGLRPTSRPASPLPSRPIVSSAVVQPRVAIDASYRAAITETLAARATRVPTVVTLARPPAPEVSVIGAAILTSVEPERIATRAVARFEGLREAMASFTEQSSVHTLSTSLADRVAALHPERFLPGLDTVRPDTVTVLEVNAAAVAAIVAGANHELERELAWRGVPVAAGATLLRTVWSRTHGGAAVDVASMAAWRGRLADQVTSAPTVFVLRSELVRRFPDALLYCARAVEDAQVGRRPGNETLLPLFRGLAGPDLAYVGFDRTLAALREGRGWYLVIQERPGQIRFGLDAQRREGADASWMNLSWDAVAADPYLRLPTPPPGFPHTPRWGASAAAMAAITERPSVRVAIHVDELFPV